MLQPSLWRGHCSWAPKMQRWKHHTDLYLYLYIALAPTTRLPLEQSLPLYEQHWRPFAGDAKPTSEVRHAVSPLAPGDVPDVRDRLEVDEDKEKLSSDPRSNKRHQRERQSTVLQYQPHIRNRLNFFIITVFKMRFCHQKWQKRIWQNLSDPFLNWQIIYSHCFRMPFFISPNSAMVMLQFLLIIFKSSLHVFYTTSSTISKQK